MIMICVQIDLKYVLTKHRDTRVEIELATAKNILQHTMIYLKHKTLYKSYNHNNT